MHRSSMKSWLAILAAGVVTTASFAVVAGSLPQQTSSERGVTIRATPRDLSSTAKAWEFDIVLETHSQDLSDDLAKSATLVADGGKKASPTAWEGDPPGGHHRKGVLRFAPFAQPPSAVELVVLRPGESSPRILRWQTK